jgi:uncharacterized hydrophobic protein (TIGR00341 family)
VKQLQIDVPREFRDQVEEVVSEYASDYTSTETEKEGEEGVQFTTTVASEDIDELTEELKGIKEIESGQLLIRVLQQESLIEKGQETRGYASTLSQEEIYSKAQQFADYTRPQWGLIAISSAIAAYGLILNNIILVIGAMMLAPLLSPFVSGAVSLAVGDRTLMINSFRSGFLSALLVVFISYISVLPLPVSVTPAMEMVISPGLPALLLSMLVGAAAALTFATGLRDQIAGVAVAIALVPPLAGTGIALKMGNAFLGVQSATVAVTNMFAVIIAGFLSFNRLGLRPSTYYKKKEAERIKLVVPAAFVIMVALMIPVTYISYQNFESYSLQKTVENEANDYFGSDLMEVEFQDSRAYITVIGDHNQTEFLGKIPDDAEVTVRELSSAG